MTDYYVNPSVVGPGAGTEADPWKSYASLPGLSAGDRVLQRAGTTFVGSVTVNASGSSGSPIIFTSYGDGAPPIVDANGVADASCFYGSAKDYWRVTGLTLIGATDFPGAGVRAVDCSGVEVDNCTIAGTWYGVRAEATGSSPISGLSVHNNTISDTLDSWVLTVASDVSGGTYSNIQVFGNTLRRSAKTGISIQTREPGVTVTAPYAVFDVVIEDNTLDTTQAYGMFLKGIFSSTSGYGKNRIRRNTVRNTGWLGLQDTHCIWLGGCQWFEVDWNRIADTFVYTGFSVGSGVGIYIDIFSTSFGCSNMRVRRNLVERAGQGGTLSAVGGCAVYVYKSADVLVEANIAIQCRNGFAAQGSGSAPDAIRIQFYNNTAINCDGSGSAGAGFIAIAQAKIVDIINNIVVGGKLGLYKQTSGGAVTTFSESYNVFYGQSVRAVGDGNGTTTSPGSGTAPAGTDLLTDPLIDAMGRLQLGSPALQTGSTVAALRRDHWGTQRRKLPSRGAHEPATFRRAIA